MAAVASSGKGEALDAFASTSTSSILPSRTLRRAQVAQLICQGHILVVHRRLIYRLNAWLASHPGGALAILHFVGRDATDELEAYHPVEVIKRMRSFAIARVDDADWSDEEGWKPLVPPVQLGWPERAEAYAGVPSLQQALTQLELNPSYSLHAPLLSATAIEPALPPAAIDPAKQHTLSRHYRQLHDDIIAADLYEPMPLWRYRFELVRYTLIFLAFAYTFARASKSWHYLLSAAVFGAFWHQVTFAAHDLGHTGVTGSYAWDRVIGALLANLVGGLSISWWADNHNIHHLLTNHPEHDPDIQHLPFFAISTRFLTDNLFSTYYRRFLTFDKPARFFVAIQHRLYYIVMSQARFNLFAQSYIYLATKAKPGRFRNFEIACCIGFWCWFTTLLRAIPGGWTRFGFVMISFMFASPVHVQIVLSHFGQDTTDMGLYECFPHRQLRTTMDVSCPTWLEFFHGGLNMQVTHHLFPRLPRHSLKEASILVQQYCADNGLDYRIHGFVEGNKGVLAVLRDVAAQAKVLGQVAQAQAKGELH